MVHYAYMITWETLTAGLIGSCVAALAAFAAAVLTIWRTRVGERRRGLAASQAADEGRRRVVVAEVISALRGLEQEVRFAPFLGGRAVAASLRCTMLFVLSEQSHHPMVAAWLFARHDSYTEVVAGWRRWWWTPIVRKRRLVAMGEHLAKTVMMLLAWATGKIEDDWFADPRREPEQ